MVETFLNLLVQGVLIGGLYALFALGLSLSLGVMRFVNIAHGDMIVLFSFVVLSLTGVIGWSPFVVALILMPVAFGAGYILQRLLLQRTVGKGILPILLVTFGLSIIIQNGCSRPTARTRESFRAARSNSRLSGSARSTSASIRCSSFCWRSR